MAILHFSSLQYWSVYFRIAQQQKKVKKPNREGGMFHITKEIGVYTHVIHSGKELNHVKISLSYPSLFFAHV
jgi:hypothetical protein